MDMIERVARAICRVNVASWAEDDRCGFSVDQLVEKGWRDCVPDAKAAIAAILDWQPIETAPKDGTPILAVEGDESGVVWWEDQWRDHGDMGACGMVPFEPTHWMPAPTLKSDAAGEDEQAHQSSPL